MKIRITNTKRTKKLITAITTALCTAFMTAMTVSAAGANLGNAQSFVDGAVNILSIVVTLIGGGLAIFGVVNLLEGYGNDNPGSKSQGMKQAMAGVGLIILAWILIPLLSTLL